MKYLLLSMIFVMMFMSCSFFSEEKNIDIIIPDPPLQISETFHNLSVWITISSVDGSEGSTILPVSVASLSVSVSKSGYSFILAEWCNNGIPVGIKAIGGICGTSNGESPESIALSWYGGFAAECCIACIRKGYDISGFNADRFRRLLEQKAKNPWEYDMARIEEDIANGLFNSFSLKLQKKSEHTISLTEGSWFFDNPFYPEIYSDGITNVSLGELPRGFYTLFKTYSGEKTEIMVNENEVISLTP